MHSTTKIRLSLETLSAITLGTLGVPAIAAEELADGWFNTIYRIEIEGGAPVVIKMAPPTSHPVMRYEKNLLQTEVEVLRLLSGVEGVPVPRVLAFDPSGTLHDHEFFLMEHVPGESYAGIRDKLDAQSRAAIDAELGGICARVNALEGSVFGRYRRDRCAADTWTDSVVAMVDDALMDAQETGSELPLPAGAIRDLFVSARSELEEIDTPRLVVWDLHPGNVFVLDGRVSGIIDCDRALWGDPLMEYFFRSIAKTDPAFYTGYPGSEQMMSQHGSARRIWLYDLYLALLLVVECAFRGYPAAHLSWARDEFERVMTSAEPGWL